MKSILIFILFLVFSSKIYGQFSVPKLLLEGNPLSNDLFFNDFDNDGDKDIVYSASSNNRLLLLFNDGNGNYITKDTLLNCEKPISNVEVGDLNNDNFKDLIVLVDSSYFVYQNINNESFNLILNIGFNVHDLNRSSAQVVDFDGDGLKDLLLCDQRGAIYRNLGNFNFSLVFWDNYGWVYKATDLNGDNLPEIVTMGPHSICVYKNNGNGSFSNRICYNYIGSIYSTEFNDFDFGDFNSDGYKDIIGYYYGNQYPYKPELVVFQNNGNTQFLNTIIVGDLSSVVNERLSNVYVVDVNNDNLQDIIIKNSSQTKFLVRNGVNSFQLLPYSYSGKLSLSKLSFDNINSDNKLDFIVDQFFDNQFSDSTNFEYINLYNFENDSLKFVNTIETYNKFYGFSNNARLIDYNKDGIEDLFGTNNCYIFNSKDSIEIIFRPPFNKQNNKGILVDFNNDNFLDYIDFPYFTDNDFQINYYKGLSDGSMMQIPNITNLNSPINIINNNNFTIEVADYQNDGDLDIVYPTNSNIKVIINQGNGIFSNNSLNLFQNHSPIQNLGDIFRVKMENTFSNQIFSVSSNISNSKLFIKIYGFDNIIEVNTNIPLINSLEIIDIDNDSYDDILLCSSDGIIKWYKNNGNGSIIEMNTIATLVSSDLTSNPYFNYVLKDFDTDGDIDIFYTISNYSKGRLGWIENYSYGNFSNEKIILNKNASLGYGLISNPLIDQNNNILFFVGSGVSSNNYSDRYTHRLYKIKNLSNSYNDNISGCIFHDVNSNQIFDSDEFKTNNVKIKITPIDDVDFTNNNGVFSFYKANGNYLLFPEIDTIWRISTDSVNYHIVIDSLNNNFSSLNFGIIPDTLISTNKIELIGGYSKCDLDVNYWINLKNIGTKINSGIIKLDLDTNIQVITSTVATDSVELNHYYWHFDSIRPFETIQIRLVVKMPSYTFMNNNLVSKVTSIILDSNDVVLSEDTDTLTQLLTCGYDPNDKIVEPKGVSDEGYIPLNKKYFEYTIRFQNTGNDTATNIKIIDHLSNLFDFNSLRVLGSSHNVDVSILNNDKLIFDFKNINLPDSSTNFLESQGYIKFGLKAFDNVKLGDKILNYAAIFFDQNPAIVTNSVKNTYYSCDSIINIENFNYYGCIGNQLMIKNNSNFATLNVWKLNNNNPNFGNEFIYTRSQQIDTISLVASNEFCLMDTFYIQNNIQLPESDIIGDILDTVCVGDELILSSSNSTSNFWYFNNQLIGVNQFLSVQTPGVYILRREQSGCVASDSILVDYESKPISNLADSYSTCSGNVIQLDAPYLNSNSWYFLGSLISTNNQVSISTSGWYVYQTIQNSCQLKDTFFLNIIESPNMWIYIDTLNLKIVAYDSPGNLYQWIDCQSLQALSGQNNNSFEPTQNGSYAVIITNVYGCIDTSECFSFSSLMGFEENNFFNLEVSPNPASNILNINNIELNQIVNIEIYDSKGLKVLERNNNFVDFLPVNLTDFETGLYTIKLLTFENLYYGKFVVKSE